MSRSKSFWWAGLSLVVMLVGAFGPWAKVLGVITVNGTDDGKDGWLVVGAAVLAAVALMFLLLRGRGRWLAAVPLLAGCVGAGTAAYDISDIGSVGSGTLGAEFVSTEWGIYVAFVGSVSLLLASLVLLRELARRTPAPLPEGHLDPVSFERARPKQETS